MLKMLACCLVWVAIVGSVISFPVFEPIVAEEIDFKNHEILVPSTYSRPRRAFGFDRRVSYTPDYYVLPLQQYPRRTRINYNQPIRLSYDKRSDPMNYDYPQNAYFVLDGDDEQKR